VYAGIPLEVISQGARHSSPVVTRDSHAHAESLVAAQATIGALFMPAQRDILRSGGMSSGRVLNLSARGLQRPRPPKASFLRPSFFLPSIPTGTPRALILRVYRLQRSRRWHLPTSAT
jgi:hypothetical protein